MKEELEEKEQERFNKTEQQEREVQQDMSRGGL
jgi:hypothetical protein